MELKIHNFKYHKILLMSMDISKTILDLTETFPNYEKFVLKNQMYRSSVSMPSNIEEGSYGTRKSFSHYLDISLGLSFELQTQLLLTSYKKYLSAEDSYKIEIKIEEFQKETISFQNMLNK